MADNENNNTATEDAPSLTFADMAAGAVEQLENAEPAPDELDEQPDPQAQGTDEPATGEPEGGDAPVDETPAEAEPQADDATPEAAAAKPKPGSVWDHVSPEARQRVLAIAQKADGHRAAAAATDGTGTDQPAAAETDKPVVDDGDPWIIDVAKDVLSGSPTSDEVTAKIAAVKADGYDELADALQATVEFAAQQTREAGEAAGAVVELVEALDQKQVAEQEDEQDTQLFAAALDARPGTSDEQLLLIYRMVKQGVVTPAEGENPYDLAVKQLEDAGIALGATEEPDGEAETPKAESTAKRVQRRKLAAAASSSSGGGADSPPDLAGFDSDSIRQAMDDDHPMFRGLLKPT